MEYIIALLLGFLVLIIVLPLVAMSRSGNAQRRVDDLTRKIEVLQNRVNVLAATVTELRKQPPQPAPPAVVQAEEPVKHVPRKWHPPLETEKSQAARESQPPEPVFAKSGVPEVSRKHVFESPRVETSSFTLPLAPPPVPSPAQPPGPAVNWEQFMGAKLFAWVGGLALFLGVAFFIKYSFDRNLIPPELRVAIGFVAGLGLLAGGLAMRRKETAVTAQTLCGTGILVLYGVTFACRSFYHFPFFQQVPTFVIMTLITATAFLVSVRLNALAVAVLALAGGFLTPILLSTRQDAPLALFGYIALLDIGLLAVALRRRWNALPVLGAIGTIVMQGSWVAAFFVPGKYFEGDKIFIAMAVFAGFEALFIIAAAVAVRAGREIRTLTGSALATAAVAIGTAFFFLSFESLGHRPAVLFGYVFVADVGILALAFLDRKIATADMVAGLAVFSLLAAWTQFYISPELLYVGLGLYFIFALFHSAAPVVLHKLRGTAVPVWCNAFPALALALVMIPILTLPGFSMLVWPLVLLIDILAVALAVVTSTAVSILAALVLTLLATGAWVLRIPGDLTGLPTSLFVLGGFAVFFIATAGYACRRLAEKSGAGQVARLFGPPDAANLSVQIPALSVVLPFVLLIMMTLRLPLADPSPVFGLALLLTILLIGLAKIMSLEILPSVGLASVIALEYAWHLCHFRPALAATPAAWYLAFYFVFTVFPFLFHRQFANRVLPWATAALAGPLHFYLGREVLRHVVPQLNGAMGLIPAAFSVPALIGVGVLLKRTPVQSPARNAQLAWFGGVTLFFFTAIFPVQFRHEWLTIGWALEGAALCWLLHRVPHRGLALVGAGLLLTAFVRLALNPAVLGYHARSGMPVLNWYLYTYGIAAACLFAGAWLLAPPRNIVLGSNVQPLLYGCGTVLGFLLLNIEIADYFTGQGAASLTFEFSGNFARDMSLQHCMGAVCALAARDRHREKNRPCALRGRRPACDYIV